MGRIVLELQLLADSHYRQVSLRRPLLPLTGAALAKCPFKCGVIRLSDVEFTHEPLSEMGFQCCNCQPAVGRLVNTIGRRATAKNAAAICKSGFHRRAQLYSAVVKRNQRAAGLSRAREMEQ